MLSDTLESAGQSPTGNAPPAVPRPVTPAPSASSAAGDATGQRAAPAGDDRPHATVDIKLANTSGQRGSSIQISANVTAAGEPCTFSRVDVVLRDAAGVETWLGAFPTDGNGRLEGRITVPFDIDVGDYKVLARTPGTGRCGASR